MHERRFHPSQMHRLENPDRLNWLPPQEIVASLHLQPGWTVADIGAGTGYFALPIAAALGGAGRVYAVDVSPEMLARLRQRLTEAGLGGVEFVEAEATATTLPAGSCDCALLANVWHEFDDRAAVLAEMRRILRPGGQIALLDWRPDVEPEHGPPTEHRISAESASESLKEAGFRPAAAPSFFRYSWLLTGQCP